MKIKKSDMEPGVVYYVVHGFCPDYFNFEEFFTTSEEADIFREEMIEQYDENYRYRSATQGLGNTNTVRTFISKHRAMIEG